MAASNISCQDLALLWWRWSVHLRSVLKSASLVALCQKCCPDAGQKYFPCSADNLDACPTVGQYMEDFFGFEYDFRWWCVLILLVFIMFFRVAAMIVLKFVNHQKR